MIKVAILDDHKLILQGLEGMLAQETEIKVVGRYTRNTEMMEQLATDKPDVLLLDINLSDGNGLEICKKLRQEHPSLQIIALSNLNEPGTIKTMIRNGALGYLLKNTEKQELVSAISQVHQGIQFLPRNIREILLNDSLGNTTSSNFIPKLTRREKEVLQLIAQEHTTQEIAEKLFISTKTVESHRNNLLQKFQARNSAGLIKNAIEKGCL